MSLLNYEDFLNEGQMSDAKRWSPSKHKEFHEAKKQLLSEVRDTLKGCKWWIDFGTLLGAVREGDFIKADNDTDVGVLAKHIDDDFFKKVEENPKITLGDKFNEPDNWFMTRIHLLNDKGNKLSVHGKQIFCDIYVYYPFEDYYVMRQGQTYFKIPGDHAGKLVDISINGIRVPAPSNAKKYIESIYGEDWEKPNDGRTQHYNIINTHMKNVKKYKYDRKNDKGIIEYNKTYLKEKENGDKK